MNSTDNRITCWIGVVCLMVNVFTVFIAFTITKWLNRIPNTAESFTKWGSMLPLSLTAGCLVLVIGIFGIKSDSRSFSFAGKVAVGTAVVLIFPVVGWTLAIFAYDYIILVPSAFFGATVVRLTIDAWLKKKTGITPMVLSAFAFECCVFSSLLYAKASALGWAAGYD